MVIVGMFGVCVFFLIPVQCMYKFQAPCCKKFYPCRVCHDENENHEIDRRSVVEIRCVKCQLVQKVCNCLNFF